MGAKGSKEAAAVEDRTTHALTWSQPDRHGVPPSPRNGHTCDLIDSKLFIFGGGDKADLLNELHVFNVHTLTWSMPPKMNSFESIRSHVCPLRGDGGTPCRSGCDHVSACVVRSSTAAASLEPLAPMG